MSNRDIVEADFKASSRKRRREAATATAAAPAAPAPAAATAVAAATSTSNIRRSVDVSGDGGGRRGGRRGGSVSEHGTNKGEGKGKHGGGGSSSSRTGGTKGASAPVVIVLSATSTWKRDARPDRKNNEYHSLYSGDVALYRRGTNTCVGLENEWVRWDDGRNARSSASSAGGGNTASSKKKKKKKKSRYYHVKPKAADKIVKIVTSKRRGDTDAADNTGATVARAAPTAAPSFISVFDAAAKGDGVTSAVRSGSGSSSGGGGGSGDGGTASADDSGAAGAAGWVDHDGGGGGGAVVEREETKGEWILRRTAAFNKQLRKTPGDVEVWRAFVAFQDEAFGHYNLHHHGGSGSATALLLDKKLSMFEQALKHNPNNDTLIAEHL